MLLRDKIGKFYETCLWRFEAQKKGLTMLFSYFGGIYRCLIIENGQLRAANLGEDLIPAKEKFAMLWLEVSPAFRNTNPFQSRGVSVRTGSSRPA